MGRRSLEVKELRQKPKVLPYTAVLGLESAKLALEIGYLESAIGGILLKGPKGTAKSTLVRAFAQLLGDERPFVNLPLSATEDRVIGSLDIEALISESKAILKPGLFAMAHNGILYVDEINLLPDHLVDLLLDVSASHVNIIERDGVTYSHEAKFLLVGSMNEEEGPIRPQLLDRFGISVEIEPITEVGLRSEIAKRRLEFEKNPERFCAQFKDFETEIKKKLENYQPPNITRPAREFATKLVIEKGITSLRAEISLLKAARAYSFLCGNKTVTKRHLQKVAPLALGHRLNKEHTRSKDQSSSANYYSSPNYEIKLREKNQPTDDGDKDPLKRPKGQGQSPQNKKLPNSVAFDVGHLQGMSNSLTTNKMTGVSSSKGRAKAKSQTGGKFGYESYLEMERGSVDFFQSALTFGKRKTLEKNAKLEAKDIMVAKNRAPKKNLIGFVLDTSESMNFSERLNILRGLIEGFLRDAYHAKDKVFIITCGGNSPKQVLNPTSSLELARSCLENLTVGGKTPLEEAISQAMKNFGVTDGYSEKLVIITDAKPTLSKTNPGDPWKGIEEVGRQVIKSGLETYVITPDEKLLIFAQKLAELIGGKVIKLRRNNNALEKLIL